MENLLNCKGRKFSAKIDGIIVKHNTKGKIQIEDGEVFLCQNDYDGENCEDKLGYKYSWIVGDGSNLDSFKVYDFKLLDEEIKRDGTPEEKAKELVESFKNENNFTHEEMISDAKESATVCVGFIEQALINYGRDNMELQNTGKELNYWNEVKLEIQKL